MKARRTLIYTVSAIILLGMFGCAGLYSWSQLDKGDDPKKAVIVETGSNIFICEVDDNLLSGFRKVKLKPGKHTIGVVYRGVESGGNLQTNYSGSIKYFGIDGSAGDYFSIINIDKYNWNPTIIGP